MKELELTHCDHGVSLKEPCEKCYMEVLIYLHNHNPKNRCR